MNESSPSERKTPDSIETILSNTKYCLERIHLLNGDDRKVRVKEMSLINTNTVLCEFYPYATNSPDIKGEICTIIGFFNGFLAGNENAMFKYFAVKAYDEHGQMVLYALSSKEVARSIGEGNVIEWLKGTLFQENTDDYRLGMAKRIISEIENSLRYAVVNVFEKEFQQSWWDQAMNNKLGQSVKEVYVNQFGFETSDGRILINFTYTIQLKKIITTHWTLFKHLFSEKIEFENTMDDLNVIRREEAHNRTISASHLDSLNNIYSILLSKIVQIYTDLVPAYLIDNWRLQVGIIMGTKYEPLYTSTELIEESDTKRKLEKSVKSAQHLAGYLGDTIHKLSSIVIPVRKNAVHGELIDRLEKYRILQTEVTRLTSRNGGSWS